MNIVIGATDLAWIGGRLTRELVDRLPTYGVTAEINQGPADLEYHQIVYDEPTRRPAVGMFTHGYFRPKRYATAYDGQVALNPVMLRYLRETVNESVTGVRTVGPCLIRLPVADDFIRPVKNIVFGVAGRTYGDGRKGEHLVKAMVEHGYTVRAWGSGWPCEIVGSDLTELPVFYRSLDYYVDTSSDEGGCVPALEAMAMGVPVISHTLGVDRPVLAYETHDWVSLERVLKTLTRPQTYDDWAREHATYFKAVITQNWNAFWEQSA